MFSRADYEESEDVPEQALQQEKSKKRKREVKHKRKHAGAAKFEESIESEVPTSKKKAKPKKERDFENLW